MSSLLRTFARWKLQNEAIIRATKYILRIIVGVLATVYTVLMLLTSLPAFQRWGAGVASRLLQEKIESRVSIGKLRLNLLGHVVLDNVRLYDRQDTLMLQASRIAAKVDLMPLIDKRIRVSGAQLIGTKAVLYKDGDAPCNYQFLVDAFSSQDTTKSPLNLRIGALVVRRGDVRFDRLNKTETPGLFNPNHLHISNLSLTAKVYVNTPDTLAIDLRNLSFAEQSGLNIKRLNLEAKAGKSLASIENLLLELPNSLVKSEEIRVKNNSNILGKGNFSFFHSFISSFFNASICPRDLSCFVPKLSEFADIISLSSDVRLEDGNLQLPNLSIGDSGGNISLISSVNVQDLQNTPALFADIKELRTGPALQHFLTENLQGRAKEISPILTRLGSTKSSGTIALQDKNLRTNLLTESEQGTISLKATLRDLQELEADIAATNIRLGHLLALSDKARGTTATMEATVTGHLPKKDRQAKLSVSGLLNSLTFKGYEHRNIPFSASIDGKTYSGEVTMDEPNGLAFINGQSSMVNGKRTLECQVQLKDFIPHDMNLTEGYEGEHFSGTIEAAFSDINPDKLQGEMKLNDLKITSKEKGTYDMGGALLTSEVTENGLRLRLKSDFLVLIADGNIHWQTLPASLMQPIRQNLPSLFPSGSKHTEPSGNEFRFFAQVLDTLLTERVLDSDLRLSAKSMLEGSIHDGIGQFALQLNIPKMQTAGQTLQNIFCRTEAGGNALQTSLQCKRIMKGKSVELNLDAYATNDKITSRLHWDNNSNITHKGDISLTALVRRDLADATAIDAKMNDSHINVGDSLWHIEPATIKYHDKVIDVENLSFSLGQRHINIGGRLSELPTDTLTAELADIDIGYIMDLVNFHKVDFDGRTTGSIYATSLLKEPFCDAFLQVKNFTFNAADLGDMDLYANWGKQKRAILLEANMRGPFPQHQTQVEGTIIPGKGQADGLNLNIQTSHIDLSFMNKFTKGIFRDLQGRASGWARVFGPFKTVNLEGDLLINDMKMHVLSIGTDYRIIGDSIKLRPDNIWLKGTRIYDYLGMPGMGEHMATVDAHLEHDALKDLTYDITINSRNLLCYNFPHQGSTNFYGTVYADATVELKGGIREVNINVDATPTPGTTLIYNVATPGTVTETEFVTYGPLSSPASGDNLEGEQVVALPKEENVKGGADIRINFAIHANPNAQIRLLMDARSGDNISLLGSGLLHANYYNKGSFRLYGDYTVSEGTYRMSLRDLIRKDFTFQEGGTIDFNGNAMEATLNLTAKHTVPNVSLDDLSPTGLGLSNTRVDCIMNLTGTPKAPAVSFDFDIPNANADEKQMVRSMMNSEEERDMQAIYLLGVGRFYTYGTLTDAKQTKSSMALNSVLSSALSSRFNQIMSQALGGTGWTFGTNLRTGEDGWQELDVEGLVSGKMLSGRLLFNGNFGYRENKYKMNKNNFIGDFDIQYRLSPRSPFSLKAYNQTNDRYFTQSSLTTQGIGIKFQRDFSRFLELFHRTKNKGKKE